MSVSLELARLNFCLQRTLALHLGLYTNAADSGLQKGAEKGDRANPTEESQGLLAIKETI